MPPSHVQAVRAVCVCVCVCNEAMLARLSGARWSSLTHNLWLLHVSAEAKYAPELMTLPHTHMLQLLLSAPPPTLHKPNILLI